MAAKRITERCLTSFVGAKVNRDGGYIDDVLICGLKSANNRDYPDPVHARDHGLYENRPVNCDHGRDSTVDRRLGWFTNVRHVPGSGSRGRFNLLKSHPMYERAMEAAERNPALFGFSHVAMCETRRDISGREIVEAIKSVESIDLVADPATTNGFFESRGTSGMFTIKMLSEWVAKHPKSTSAQSLKAKKLAEMDGVGEMPMADAPAEGADPNDAITAGFKAAFDAIRDQLFAGKIDWKEAQKKLKSLHAGHGDATGTAAPKGGDGEGGEEEEAAEESRKRPTVAAVIEECRVAGYAYASSDLVALTEMSSKAARDAFIEAKKTETAKPGANPTQASRRPGAGVAGVVPAATTKTTEQKVENQRLIPSWD